MKLKRPAACIIMGIFCATLLAGCDLIGEDKKEPVEENPWPGKMEVAEGHGVSWDTTLMEHEHTHAASFPCPQEEVGVITFKNFNTTEFLGKLELETELVSAGVSLDPAEFIISEKNGTAEITVLFNCVTPGRFLGFAALSAVDDFGTVFKTDETAILIEVVVP